MLEEKEYFCETDIKAAQSFTLNWKIPNGSEYFYLFSEVFEVEVGKQEKLKIQLIMEKGWYNQHTKYCVCSKISAKYKGVNLFKIVNMSLSNIEDNTIKTTVQMHHENQNDFSYTYSSQPIGSNDWITSLSFPIHFKIILNVMELASDLDAYTPKVPILDNNSLTTGIINDLEKMHIKGSFSDFTISSSDKIQFPVHKNILSCRSPYFKKMLEVSEDLTIYQSSIKAVLMKEVLDFIYTGKTANVKTYCMDLLDAAFKWELSGLLSVCEAVVISQFSVAGAPKILILADDYSMLALREEVISFIVQNAEQVGKLAIWREMMKIHPHLIAEVTFQLQVANSKKISEDK